MHHRLKLIMAAMDEASALKERTPITVLLRNDSEAVAPPFDRDVPLRKLRHRAADTIDALVAALEFVATSGVFICYDDRGWDTVNDALALARGGK